MKIVFATGNPHKLQEVNDIAKGSGVEFILPPKGFDPIEDGTTFEENSYIKAKDAARLSGMLALADDSGLCAEALDGAPGIYSARYADTPQARIDKLLNAMSDKENRKAKFVCAMTIANPDGEILFQTRGECHGEIAKNNPAQTVLGMIRCLYQTSLRMSEGKKLRLLNFQKKKRTKFRTEAKL